jgi:hypothetical protein
MCVESNQKQKVKNRASSWGMLGVWIPLQKRRLMERAQFPGLFVCLVVWLFVLLLVFTAISMV